MLWEEHATQTQTRSASARACAGRGRGAARSLGPERPLLDHNVVERLHELRERAHEGGEVGQAKVSPDASREVGEVLVVLAARRQVGDVGRRRHPLEPGVEAKLGLEEAW